MQFFTVPHGEAQKTEATLLSIRHKYIILVSQTASPKGRTIRKVMGGGVGDF